MGKSSQYTHYMQRIDVAGTQEFDIENEFTGLRYMKAEGLYDIGKPKNVYTEDYADIDRKRVFFPPDANYANEGTKVTMRFLIIGSSSSRQQTLRNFEEFIRKGIIRYWDNARNLQFDFIVTEELKVSEEKWHGSTPYIEIAVPMQNLNGRTTVHTT